MTRRERKAAERRERATEKKFERWLQMLELRYQLTGEEYVSQGIREGMFEC